MANKTKKQFAFEECRFVRATEVFGDLPKAWDAFVAGEPPFSWGDNNRSLVTADAIRLELANVSPPDGADKEIKAALRRLTELDQEYVDLEN